MADNITLPGAASVVATDDVGGIQYQRVKPAYGADGSATDVSPSTPLPVQQRGPTAIYRWLVPSQAVGANKVFGDLFNASGSGKTLRVISAFAYVDLATAITGTVGVQLSLTRTSAVGTGGTAATADGTSLTANTISKFDPSAAALPSQVTARAAPSGGATAGAWLATRYPFTEETNAGSAIAGALGCEFIRNVGSDLLVPEGTGLRFVQGTVASAGNVAFEVNFELI